MSASLRLPIIRQINKFVDLMSILSDVAPLGFRVIKIEGRRSLSGLLTDDGLTGMLEAADINRETGHDITINWRSPLRSHMR